MYPDEERRAAPRLAASLTDYQKETVHLLSIGYCVKEVAAMREVTVRYIQRVLAESRERCSVMNNTELVAYCIREGIIK